MNFKNGLLLFISLFLLSACGRGPKKDSTEKDTPTVSELKEKLSQKKKELEKINEELLKTKDRESCLNLSSQALSLAEEIEETEKAIEGNKNVQVHLDDFGLFCTDKGYSPPKE